MLNSKYDREIERLMGDEGLTHAEAMAKVKAGSKKSGKPLEGSPEEEAEETPEEEDAEEPDDDEDDATDTVDLPAALVPGASVGKEVDVSVTGIVKSKANGMVCIELSRMSGSAREPYKPSTGNAPEVAR